MKKLIPLILALVCVLGLAGCAGSAPDGEDTSPNSAEAKRSGRKETADGVQPGSEPESRVFDSKLSYASWTEENEIYFGALNKEKMLLSSVRHLPIYKFDTAEDLERFKSTFGGALSMEDGWDEVPSFNDAIAEYNKAYFEENTLMLVYVSANNSTHRYRAKDVFCDNTTLCIHVEETTEAEEVDDAMAGWFITVEVPDGMAAGCTEFDAVLS